MRDDRVTDVSFAFVLLAVVSLLVPFVGVACGSLLMAFGRNKQMDQGLLLFLLGVVPLAVLAALRFA